MLEANVPEHLEMDLATLWGESLNLRTVRLQRSDSGQQASSKPGAVHICFTVAVELMLACDIAIAADDCRFAQMEVARGIMPSRGATVRLVDRIGWSAAMELLLTGKEFGARKALELGLVQEVVPAGTQFDRALEVARSVALQAPLAVQAVLANARAAQGTHARTAWREVEALQTRLYATADAQEGILAFQEKRAARFIGR